MYKIARVRTACGSCDVERWHAAVARSTFASQAKHICKSKCKKHLSVGAFLEVGLWKICTRLWREAHFASQNAQNTSASEHSWTLGCGKFARRCSEKHIPKSKCQNHEVFGLFLRCGCRKIVVKWHAAVAPSKFASQTVKNTCVLHNF